MSRTPRLRLESALPEHAGEMLACIQQDTVANFVMFQKTVTLDDQRAFLERMQGSVHQLFVARNVAQERMIGTVGLHEVDSIHETARLGVLIFRKDDRGVGYGTEMILRALSWAFLVRRLNRVYLQVKQTNTRGQALYRSLGFVQEGVLRDAYKDKSGFNDLVVMSLLASEWNQMIAREEIPLAILEHRHST